MSQPNPQTFYYRRNDSGRHLPFRPPGGELVLVPPGAWVRADQTIGAPRAMLTGLGAPVKAGRLPPEMRAPANARPKILTVPTEATERPGLVVCAPADIPAPWTPVPADVVHDRIGISDLLEDYPAVIGIVSEPDRSWWVEGKPGPECAVAWGCERTLGADAPHADNLKQMEAIRDATGADIVIPLSNVGPQALPMAGERGAYVAPRLPPAHWLHVQLGLRFVRQTFPRVIPFDAPADMPVVYSERAHDIFSAKRSPRFAGTVLDLEAWLEHPELKAVFAETLYWWTPPPSTALAFDDRPAMKARLSAWPDQAARYCRAVRDHRPLGPLVQFLAVDLGTWGGSYCTLRLAHELNMLGFHAQVGRLREVDCREAFPLGTVHHQSEQRLPQDFRAASGWGDDDGVLVATHWSTGRLVNRICEGNTGITSVAFWQDLEHRFVDPKTGVRRFPLDQAREYVGIPNRVINALWQMKEGGDEFGIDFAEPGLTEFIPVGVDTDVFFPWVRKVWGGHVFDAKSPLRIVAMYRPQTPRRGAARLLEVYRRLHEAHGDRVSLEIFGWTGPEVPAYVKSHGYLMQRQVADLLREADAYLETSDFQGFGLPGLEAMACGAILVSTDTKGVWAYADKQSAIITSHDPAEIARAFRVFFDGDVQAGRTLAAMQGAALARARNLSWRRIAARWAQYLCDLWRMHDKDRVWGKTLQIIESRAEDILQEPIR